jgi:hypothetical protein
MPRAIGCLDAGTVGARHHEGIGERDDVLDQIVPMSPLGTWALTLSGARDLAQLWVSGRPEPVEEGRWSVQGGAFGVPSPEAALMSATVHIRPRFGRIVDRLQSRFDVVAIIEGAHLRELAGAHS